MPREPADLALGRAVRALREKKGLTQENLAHDAGITFATLARIERGQVNPTWTTVRRVATALEVSMSELGRAVDKAR